MTTTRDEEKPNKPKENLPSDKEKKDFSHKQNPDPRANSNIPEKKKDSEDESGVGSEITDGESG